jgi:arylsulfatase A-like enzyme
LAGRCDDAVSQRKEPWEGVFRVPAMVRWLGKIKPGVVSSDIMSHLDWLPTLLAAAGMSDVKEKLLTGYRGCAVPRRQSGPRQKSVFLSHLTHRRDRRHAKMQGWFDRLTLQQRNLVGAWMHGLQ